MRLPAKAADCHQAVVLIVSDDPALAMSLEVVCDFLSLGVEHIASSEDIMAALEDYRPMAVVTEMDCRDRDGFNVMMTVSRYDPDLPIMLLTDHDPRLTGAAEAVAELWGLSAVAKAARLPKIGDLVDFFFTAGRRTGCMRLMSV
jgi:DNA-binding NtrC family response regulator